MENLKILISKKELQQKIRNIAKQIKKDYTNKDITFVCILKGSILFLADLIKNINNTIEIEFMKASSYGENTESSRTN